MKYIIREAKKEDMLSIAHVVTVSWNETYQGIVPDWFLSELKTNEEERAERLLASFNDFRQLVLEINKKIVGFVRYGKSSDSEFTNCGEIIAIYIINRYHGLGLGRKLFDIAKEKLIEEGFDKMIIACLKGNPTNSFYEHMNGKYVKDGLFQRLNLQENIYYFDL